MNTKFGLPNFLAFCIGPALTIEDLQNKLIDLSQEAVNIQATADAEGRHLSDDEGKRIEDINNAFSSVEVEIKRRQSVAEMHNRLNAPSPASPQVRADGIPVVPAAAAQPRPAPTPGAPRIEMLEDKGKWGFRSQAEYLVAVMKGSERGAAPDPRLLRNAPTTYGSEGIGQDGGFAVPPDFRATIVKMLDSEESLLARTDQMITSSNGITIPLDENPNWSSSGVQSYWENEAGLKTQSKPALSSLTVRANKLITLVPLTDELIQDAAAMSSYVTTKAPEMIAFRLNDAILNGTGTGQPFGILNSAGTVSVAAESGQAADTVTYTNLVNMLYRCSAESRRNGVWLMNPDVEAVLPFLSFPTSGGTVATPVYLPPGGASQAPFGTLFGRPIIPTQACKALGDSGDIVFGDLKKYLTVVKAGGLRTDISIHLWFDYDVTAFRFVLRVGGQPWRNSTIAGYNAGTATRGFFTKLAERA